MVKFYSLCNDCDVSICLQQILITQWSGWTRTWTSTETRATSCHPSMVRLFRNHHHLSRITHPDHCVIKICLQQILITQWSGWTWTWTETRATSCHPSMVRSFRDHHHLSRITHPDHCVIKICWRQSFHTMFQNEQNSTTFYMNLGTMNNIFSTHRL